MGVLIVVGLPMTANAQANAAFTGPDAAPVAAKGGEAVQFEDAAARLDHDIAMAAVDAPFGAPLALSGSPAGRDAFTTTRSEAWFAGDGFTDRLRVTARGEPRRADGAPVPPRALDARTYDDESYDVTYTRGWVAAQGRTASGLEVSLTPHAGVGFGSDGTTAEAGATLKIGEGLDRLAPDGDEAFGERARWYVYAAGSKRAVGYNFARTRDGDFARSGMSHDTGAFLGDASVGVAYRRGAVQSSFGVVYREIEANGIRAYNGINTDVSEGLVAFQLTIRPRE
ncbi:lipid A-modifier LpxR family protein [uncultured Brevundimonas sp.]|uniref:lipid A-modifier LpxR family protein n=1 Tax=uncultured Brevundimonas sp. TaxID=213418 RepID=UPI000FB5827D|nr:lipid A-modifier LpxR family protein [uncultured Brevundimonas sp.]